MNLKPGLRSKRRDDLLMSLRTGQLTLSQVSVAARFGDPECLVIAEQAGIEITQVSESADLCEAIEECGADVTLLSFMVLCKLVEDVDEESSLRLHTIAETWLKSPEQAMNEDLELREYFEYSELHGLQIDSGASLLRTHMFFVWESYDIDLEQGFLGYVQPIIIPFVLGELELEQIVWPRYESDKPIIFKAWDWFKKRLFY